MVSQFPFSNFLLLTKVVVFILELKFQCGKSLLFLDKRGCALMNS